MINCVQKARFFHAPIAPRKLEKTIQYSVFRRVGYFNSTLFLFPETLKVAIRSIFPIETWPFCGPLHRRGMDRTKTAEARLCPAEDRWITAEDRWITAEAREITAEDRSCTSEAREIDYTVCHYFKAKCSRLCVSIQMCKLLVIVNNC